MSCQKYVEMRSEMVEQAGPCIDLGERMQDLLKSTRMTEIDEYIADVREGDLEKTHVLGASYGRRLALLSRVH
jgi:hypothetical protein